MAKPEFTPTEFMPVKYPLTGGVNSKALGLSLPPPQLQTVENAYVDQTGSLQRRYGRSAVTNTDSNGNTLTEWVAAATYQSRLIGFSSTKLYDYSPSLARWVDAGRATSWRMRTQAVDAGDVAKVSTGVQGGAKDIAVLASGAYRCYAYEYYETTAAGTITTRVAVSLVDSSGARVTSNKVLATVTAAAAHASSVKVVAHGTRFYVVYWDVNSAANLKCFIVDTTSAATIATSLAASPTTLANTLGVIGGLYAPLDMCDDLWHGPFVCYRSTTANTINTGFITTAGALTATNTVSSGAADCVTISCDGTSIGSNTELLGIAFTLGTAPNDVYARLRSYNGTTWTSVASSGAMDTGLTAALTRAVSCKFDSATVLRVFYDYDTNVTLPCIRQGTYSTGGTIVSQDQRLNRSIMASKPFVGLDGSTYLWVMNDETNLGGPVQPTLFLMKYDGTLAAVADQGIAVYPGISNAYALGHVVADSNAKSFAVLADYYTRIGTDGKGSTSASHEVIIDMSHVDSHVTVEDGECLYVPGGVLQQYDGISCTENNFLVFVDTQNRVNLGAAASTAGAGALTSAAGTIYGYRVIPEWTNARGAREQGTDNGPKATAAFAAGDNTVTFTIDTIPWTLKQAPKSGNSRRQQISFGIYRSLANPTADSPHYRVGTVQNDPTLDTVTFIDLMSDAVAATQEQLGADTQLDGIAPPPGHILAAGNGRVFIAGLPNDPNLVMYSKTRGHGEPLTFNDALQIVVPVATGPITGLAVLNDSLVIFCTRAVYRVNGNGLSNLGTTGGYTDPILVSTEDGAVGPRGVVTSTDGILYDSTSRGKTVVTTQFTTQYIGAPLEKLTDPGVCTGAVAVPSLQQVRFSYASTTHVFDYYHHQWYVFTHGSDGPTTVWNGAHTAVHTDVVYDDPAVWTDGATHYTMRLKLGWLTATSTQLGDLRVRSIGLVGMSLAAHNLGVLISFDQETTVSDSNFGSVATAAPLVPQWRTNRQRCYALEVTITDALLDEYGLDVVQDTAGMKLSELVFEVGLAGRRLNRYDITAPGTGLAPGGQ